MNRLPKFKINQKIKYMDLLGTIIDYQIEVFQGIYYVVYLIAFEGNYMPRWTFEESLEEC